MIKKEIFERIANGYKTPAYVYEQEVFRAQLMSLVNAINCRPLTILYALKANSNFRVVKTLASVTHKQLKGATFGLDVVSPGEAELGIRAGIPNCNMVFTGNNCSCEELDGIKKKNILINIDSLPKLEWFCNKYPGINVCIRINPNIGAGHHDHCITGGSDSKFGIWYSQAQEALAIAKRKVRIIGVHQHIGSQILNPDIFIEAMKVMFEVAVFFPDLVFIDFGGGFGVPYQPGEKPLDMSLLGHKMTALFADFCQRYSRKLRMIIEPGRFLSAEAGYLLLKVTNVKRNPDGKVFVGVDSGFNHLDRPARYGSFHEIENISNPYGSLEEVIVVGNICETGDKFTPKPRMLAEPREGDLLIIKNAGAYGYSMSSNYNLRPRPPEIMVTANNTILEIRKRQTMDEILS